MAGELTPHTFSTVTLEAEHIPERHDPAPHDKDVQPVQLPGLVNLYAVFDGGRVLIDQFKAPVVFEAIERGQQQQQAQQQADQAAQAPPAEPAQQ